MFNLLKKIFGVRTYPQAPSQPQPPVAPPECIPPVIEAPEAPPSKPEDWEGVLTIITHGGSPPPIPGIKAVKGFTNGVAYWITVLQGYERDEARLQMLYIASQGKLIRMGSIMSFHQANGWTECYTAGSFNRALEILPEMDEKEWLNSPQFRSFGGIE